MIGDMFILMGAMILLRPPARSIRPDPSIAAEPLAMIYPPLRSVPADMIATTKAIAGPLRVIEGGAGGDRRS